MGAPHFNITANIDVTHLVEQKGNKSIPFTPFIVYCVSATANAIPVFRQRIRGEEIVEHDLVHPSFSILPDHSEVFSFCYVDFQEDMQQFMEACLKRMEVVKKNPSFEDEPGRDDYLFLSSFPWVSFTGMVHAMHTGIVDSVPRISWGKYFEENGRIKMPLCVQAHHALVDGRKMGLYFQKFEALIQHDF